VDVERIHTVGVVLRCAVAREEVLLPIAAPFLQRFTKAVVAGVSLVMRQADEAEASVKVVDPALIARLTIMPGAIGQLTLDRKKNSAAC
jgi:hypothetical protein